MPPAKELGPLGEESKSQRFSSMMGGQQTPLFFCRKSLPFKVKALRSLYAHSAYSVESVYRLLQTSSHKTENCGLVCGSPIQACVEWGGVGWGDCSP